MKQRKTRTRRKRTGEMPARSDVRRHNLRLPGCWHGGDDIVPIPRTKRRKYLQENIGALDVNLTSADLARIEEVAPNMPSPANVIPTGRCRWSIDKLKQRHLACAAARASCLRHWPGTYYDLFRYVRRRGTITLANIVCTISPR